MKIHPVEQEFLSRMSEKEKKEMDKVERQKERIKLQRIK
jgi:hypothetical protein